MKKLILILVALATSQFALGANRLLTCHSVPIRPDSGYMLRFNAQVTRVVVQENSIQGPRRIASLNCTQSMRADPRHPYRTVSWQCYEPRIRDAGYSVVLNMRGFGGRKTAKLYEESIRGARLVSNLACN